ncbi:MAG: peptidylprolyl isomerase, partial [Gemmatimonadetes bacterium]|nr:peptidylprolyl isomerase [Gemmatimonadota bacterium]
LALVGSLLLLALPAGAAAGRAQVLGSERIVAVVGEDVILLSELEEQTVIAATQSGVDPEDAGALAALRREVLDQMVTDLIVVAAASADDSVSVPDNSLNDAVEAELSEIRGRFPSSAEFEQEIARSQWRTVENYRKNLRRVKRRELLAQAFLARRATQLQGAPITDDELRAYFRDNAERFGSRPVTVTIDQMDLLVEASEAARARARTLADSLMTEARRGAPFPALAREFSDDEATRERGGDLGYFGRGVMVPAFEEAAFGADSTQRLVGPVESPFGVHIIRIEDRQGDEIKARHILITPETTEADRAAARAMGQVLVDSLRAGVNFDSLQARHSRSPRPTTEPVEGPVNQLAEEWQAALKELPTGGTTGLLQAPAGYVILRLVARGGGEPYTFEELAPRLRSQLAQTRAQEALIDGLRSDVFVDVRLPDGALGRAVPAPASAQDQPLPAPTDSAGAPLVTPPVEGPPPVLGAREAYTPPGPEERPAPESLAPLENPSPVADTPPPDSLPPALVVPPEGAPAEGAPAGRVDPSGAVDTSGQTPPAR